LRAASTSFCSPGEKTGLSAAAAVGLPLQDLSEDDTLDVVANVVKVLVVDVDALCWLWCAALRMSIGSGWRWRFGMLDREGKRALRKKHTANYLR
jgi:hypothetical protein